MRRESTSNDSSTGFIEVGTKYRSSETICIHLYKQLKGADNLTAHPLFPANHNHTLISVELKLTLSTQSKQSHEMTVNQ